MASSRLERIGTIFTSNMSNTKKCGKSKFITEDLNDFKFLKESPEVKKTQKRVKPAAIEEENDSKSVVDYQPGVKKRKAPLDTAQKVQDTIIQQIESRQQCNDLLVNDLSNVLKQLDADYTVLKENEQKLENLTGALLKCIQQASAAHKHNLKVLREIHATFKKRVEGLINRGALKPDDRPLWFDVYKAFPPLMEPKFAKPLPEIKPIRPILYEEDAIRAKFHSAGQGLGVINMLSPTGETPIKKLVKQYEKLKAEGIPDSELVEKASAAVDSLRLRQQDAPPAKPIVKNPQSVTAQVMADADLKNIFNEK